MVQPRRHDRADDRGGNVLPLQATMRDQGRQPDGIFVGRPLRVGANTPGPAPARGVVHGENDVGVTGIDDKKHERHPVVTKRT